MRLALTQLVCFALVAAPWALVHTPRISRPVFRRGRRFCLGSSYVLPDDAGEQERLIAQHHLMGLVLGGPVLAPIGTPRALLDVGCGPGVWCQEMAKRFKDAQVMGLNLDISVAKAGPRLPNVRWVEANALAPLPLVSNSFDFVHLRFGATWLPFGRWPDVLAEMVRVTRPGGVIELVEGSMPESQDKAYSALCKTFDALLRARGMRPEIGMYLGKMLELAGCESVEERVFMTGKTPDEQRLLFGTTYQGFRALVPVLAQSLAPEALATYKAHLVTVEQTQPHVMRRDVVAWGRKPR